MDIVLMIVYATLILGFLVFIHEGGHYLAARAFGVRVTEFMLGLPGPNIGFTKWGTKFGVTPFLLGGYAKVCGMEPGEMSPHLEPVLAALYRRGTANMEDIARDCGITDDEAYEALDELVEWGSIAGPTKQDKYNTYRAPVVKPSKKQVAAGAVAYELGQARPVEDAHALFESEYKQQYRSLPFWKRSVILVAGVAVNLLFAVLL
ncbi:peptidase M50, partial [Eggerthella lenta]